MLATGYQCAGAAWRAECRHPRLDRRTVALHLPRAEQATPAWQGAAFLSLLLLGVAAQDKVIALFGFLYLLICEAKQKSRFSSHATACMNVVKARNAKLV